MKKDIPVEKVSEVFFAVLPKDEEFWEVYLINQKTQPLYNVLISSRGYGLIEGERRQSSQMRYFYEAIEAEAAVFIEPLPKELLNLANEFWLSFQLEAQGFLYDRKYVFVPGSLSEAYFRTIPFLDREGVLLG